MELVKKWWKKILIIVILMVVAGGILLVSPNFKKDPNEGKINFIINNNNVTGKMKQNIFIDNNGVVYVSIDDMRRYFDSNIYYDKENNQLITTSDTKVAVISLEEKNMKLNGALVKLLGNVVRKEGILYIPISELEKVYNIEVENINNSVITVESLDRELIKADAKKKISVKYNTKFISKTVDKIAEGEKVVIISESNGYTKVRTKNGKIGYVKTDDLTNIIKVREKLEIKPQIEGKINLVWDYYSEYVPAPNRNGTTIPGINVVSPAFFSLKNQDTVKINDNASESYVSWAKANGYKVWAIFSNNSMKAVTSEILNDYSKREEMIEKIVDLAVKYKLDGINVDFEYMNMSDKDIFSRFIIELAPRLREYGIVTTVDVTAPDGSENWSLCYDRDLLANQADYLIFMAYDQHGTSSTTAGTTAGADWVEVNIKKFVGQEDVPKEKIILGMPLYTRLWKTDSTGKLTSSAINMNKIESIIPDKDTVERVWDENKKQYYVEYSKGNYTYQMWIEDETSIREKLNLINKYELAGGAFWAKDRETSNIWNIAKEVLETK